jgi:4-hydroxybenzoate polyprenyltransferase
VVVWTQLRAWLEMIRFSHTLFALPFALAGAALAWKGKAEFSWPSFAVELAGILLCMTTARSAAMAFNRLADRHIDARNPRTASRHLPAGRLSVPSVWIFTLVSAAAFVGSTFLFLLATPPNPWPAVFAVPVLLFVLAYSLTKRFTAGSHFWLGASLMLAPVAAWVAVRGFDGVWVAVLLGLAVLFWVAGFDILYACQDADFDRAARLHSVPAALGVRNALRTAAACHAVMVFWLALLGWAAWPLLGGWVYPTGVFAVAVLLAYEHSLVRPDDLTRVNQAFFHVNGVISVGILAVVLLQLAIR